MSDRDIMEEEEEEEEEEGGGEEGKSDTLIVQIVGMAFAKRGNLFKSGFSMSTGDMVLIVPASSDILLTRSLFLREQGR